MRAKSHLLPIVLLSVLFLSSSVRAQVQVQPRQTAPQQQPQRQPQEQAGEIGKFSGPGSCAASNCHGSVAAKTVVRIAQNEYSIWSAQDKHARAYTVLSNPVSLRMGKILGLEQPTNKSDKCLNCHAVNAKPELRAQTFQSLEDGVSCESCHGPALGWLGPHTLKDWSHERSLKLGMYDERDLITRAENCLTCHLGTAGKEVDHTMIAAGHPDLTFQLETFTSAMPRHWKPAQNASPWLNVQELAVGQAVQLREGLNRLNRRASSSNWPDYSEYECYACHHSLTKPDASWRQAAGYRGRQPGAPVWNPATYVIFRYIANAVDNSTSTQLISEVEGIEQLSGKPGSNESVAAHAKAAAALADKLAHELQNQTYDRNLTVRLLREISSDSETIAEQGERSAEQTAMALDSLFLAFSKNENPPNEQEVRAAVNGLYQQLDNPSAYNAPRFAMQMQKVASLVPRAQTGAAGSGN